MVTRGHYLDGLVPSEGVVLVELFTAASICLMLGLPKTRNTDSQELNLNPNTAATERM